MQGEIPTNWWPIHHTAMSTIYLHLAFVVLLTTPLASLVAAQDASALAATYERDVLPLLTTYCTSCHKPDKTKGDVDLLGISTGKLALARLPVWRAVLDQVVMQEMPPAKESKRLSEAERRTLISWLKAVRRQEPADPGLAVIRRLSRGEYRNTIRDLLGAEVKVNVDLPDDLPGETFDNSVSPLLMEKYLLAADEILDQIIVPDRFSLSTPAGQLDAVIEGKPVSGKPDGTSRLLDRPGEITTTLNIPTDGSYTIKITAGGERVDKDPLRVAVRFDSQVIGELRITATTAKPAVSTLTTKLVAGRTRLSLVFLNPIVTTPTAPAAPAAPTDKSKAKEKTSDKTTPTPTNRALTVEQLEIIGPPAKRMSDIQRRIFVALPDETTTPANAAKRIASQFAERADRRPPSSEEIAALLTVFNLADAQGELFSESVKLMLKAALVSPQFLYRTPDFRGDRASGIISISDWELASRLSYVLWATMPDEELFILAREGHLHEPAVLAAQIHRLISDHRSRALAENFGATWLELDLVDQAPVDRTKFVVLTPALRRAMYEEGVVHLDDLLRHGGSLLELIDSDYAWMNAQTAKLYGEESVTGAQFQKIKLSDRNRGGVVTMPGVLLVTSEPNRTSPVKRGKWVLERLLGAAPPSPPPNVASLDQQVIPANTTVSLRERTERHRSDPACAVCHTTMDAIGFGLENFDAIGRWRTRDDYGGSVDAMGELPGNKRFTSPAQLKALLLERKDEFVRNPTARVLGFALGRHLSGYDEVVVDDISARVAAEGYRVDVLVSAVLTSYPFLNRPSYRTTRPSEKP